MTSLANDMIQWTFDGQNPTTTFDDNHLLWKTTSDNNLQRPPLTSNFRWLPPLAANFEDHLWWSIQPPTSSIIFND